MNGAAAAFITNGRGELLIVKPTYRGGWLLPGGVIEANETPKEACQRECREELGINVTVGELLCFEYRRATKEKAETTRFIFDCGTVLHENFKLPAEELSAYRFVSAVAALDLVDTPTVKRLKRIFSGVEVYFESDG